MWRGFTRVIAEPAGEREPEEQHDGGENEHGATHDDGYEEHECVVARGRLMHGQARKDRWPA
jgi:hypothetical protein